MSKPYWIIFFLLQQTIATSNITSKPYARAEATDEAGSVMTLESPEGVSAVNPGQQGGVDPWDAVGNLSSSFGNGDGDWGAEGEEFIEMEIATFLQKYGGGAVLVVGVLGNAAALVILLKEKFRSNIFNCYLIAFTAADIIFIIFDIGLSTFNEAVSDWAFKNVSNVTCKFGTYMVRASYSYSNWALAGISLNRAVAIIFPLKMKMLTNRQSNYMYLSISLGVIAVLEIYHIIGNEIVEEYFYGVVSKACAYIANPTPSMRYFQAKVAGWLYFVTSTLIPGLVILICNGVMIFTLIRRRERRSQMVSGTNSTDAQTKNIILTLVSVSTAFVVLQAPMFYISLRFLLRGNFDYYAQSSKEVARSTLEWQAGLFLLALNHSINFILYLIGGGEFRKQFLATFCCICKNKCGVKGSAGSSSGTRGGSAAGKPPKSAVPQVSLPTTSTSDGDSHPSTSDVGSHPSTSDVGSHPSIPTIE